MLMLCLACIAEPEDTAIPACHETARSIQIGPNAEPFQPYASTAQVVDMNGSWTLDAAARVGGLLVQDEEGLHTLATDIDVESEGSTTGFDGEYRVACFGGHALVPLTVPVPNPDAEQLQMTVTVSDEQGTSVFAQLTVGLDWPE